MSNTVTAFFKGRVGVSEAVYQNDYGIVMNFDSIELPAHFDCYFSVMGEDEAIPGIGADSQVVIPNSCLTRSGTVTLHIPIHTGTNDSEVEYIVYFKVIGRARPVDDGTPAQMTAIEQALALLQNPIGNIEQIVNEALAFTGDTFAEMQAALDADQAAFQDDMGDRADAFEAEIRGDISDVESDFDNLNAQYQTAVAAHTVDSEVQNVRVGADGKTYASAGEAVRTQVTDLKSGFSGIENDSGLYVSATTQNGYRKANGTYASTSSYVSKTTGFIPCSEGDVFHYTGTSTGAAPAAIFYDSSKQIIGTADDYTMTAIAGSSYVRFSSFAAINNEVTLKVVSEEGRLWTIDEDIASLKSRATALETGAASLDAKVPEDIVERHINESKTFISKNPEDVNDTAFIIADSVDQIPAMVVASYTQSGSGDPSPNNERTINGLSSIDVSAYRGKNRLEVTATTTSLNGVDLTVNKDSEGRVTSIVVDGTAASNTFFVISSDISDHLITGTDYILTGDASGSEDRSDFVLYADNGTNYFDNGDGVTFTANGSTTLVKLAVYSGTVLENKVFYPMVRDATITDNTFEPFDYWSRDTSLTDTLYGGLLNLATGVAEVTHDILTASDISVDDITIGPVEGTSGNRLVVITTEFVGYTVEPVISNVMNYRVRYQSTSPYEFYNGDGDMNVYIPSTYNTPALVKTHLESIGAYFVGRLKTPKEETLISSTAEAYFRIGKNYVYNADALTIRYAPDTAFTALKTMITEQRDPFDDEFIRKAEAHSALKRWLPYSVGTTNYVPESNYGVMYTRLSLLVMADPHLDLFYKDKSLQNVQDAYDFAQMSTAYIDDQGRDLSIKAVLNCGDVLYNQLSVEASEVTLNKMFNIAKNCTVPTLFTKGNHDNYALDDDDWGNVWFNYAESEYGIVRQTKSNGKKSTWYYYDIDAYKVRIVVADAEDIDREAVDQYGRMIYNGQNAWAISDEQLNWFASTALNFDDKAELDWGVIVLIHQGTTYSTLLDPPYESSIAKLAKLCQAFNEQSTYSNHYTYSEDSFYDIDIDADFTRYASETNKPHMICWILGHEHVDRYQVIDGINMIWTTNMACMTNASDSTLARVPNTPVENAFDIVTIDTRYRKIRYIRYGAGVNAYGYGGDRFLPDGIDY